MKKKNLETWFFALLLSSMQNFRHVVTQVFRHVQALKTFIVDNKLTHWLKEKFGLVE